MTSASAPTAPRPRSRNAAGSGVWGRRLVSAAVVATLFGAIWNFGATSTASALFWLAPQCACAALALWVHRNGAAARLFSSRLVVAWAVVFGLLLIAAASTLTPLPSLLGQGSAARFADGVSTIDPYRTGVELARLLGLSALFIAGYLQASIRRDGEELFAGITAVGAAYALWSIQAFIQHPELVHDLPKHIHAERLTASFFSANTAGALFGALSTAVAVRLMRRGRRLVVMAFGPVKPLFTEWAPVLIDLGCFLLMWSAMMLTQSRAAITISLAVVALFGGVDLVQAWRETESRRMRRRLLIAGVVALAVLLAATLSARVLGRLTVLNTDSVSRGDIFSVYRPLLAHTPAFGYGLGSFASLNGHLVTETNAPALWNLGAAHNIALQWWLEAGPVGLLLAATLVGLLLIRLVWRYFRSRTDRWRAGAALGASLVLLVHSGVDFPLQVGAVAALWAVLLGWGAAETVGVQEAARRSEA